MTADTITLHIPFRVVQRGGRKEMRLPDGSSTGRADNVIVKALARAFRWKRMLECAEFAATGDLAAHGKMAHSYMSRVLRLTLLAPDIVEAILDGTQGPDLTLARMLGPFPVDSEQQRRLLC